LLKKEIKKPQKVTYFLQFSSAKFRWPRIDWMAREQFFRCLWSSHWLHWNPKILKKWSWWYE
jgi:hypothetical protein